MRKRIFDLLSYDRYKKCHILLYRNYQFIEKYPSSIFIDESLLFCHQCLLFDIEFPPSCDFAYFSFPAYFIIIKDLGEYQLIIFKPKNYEQNSKT